MFDDGQRDRTGHRPVGARLHFRAGIGIDHHGAIRMFVAECGKFAGRTAQVERAFRFQVRHQHAFFRVEDFCGLTHEAHAGHDDGLGWVLVAEARHVERIGHQPAGFLGQVLQVRMHIVV